jgi:opacity protein-like surface antigen
MFKRLAVLCCILLLPTIAAAQGDRNYGDWWVGGQVGGVFYTEIDPGVTAGAIVGYNFCMPYRPAWQRYFGVALDFEWGQFKPADFSNYQSKGNQFALALLARLQYPLMGDERFTRGRIVPFLMFGPAVVWTNPNDGGDNRTDVGVIAEPGVEFFITPHLSIGPSYRYMYVGGGTQTVISTSTHHHMVLGRLSWHF